MCGIAGCIGTEAALPFLINGLKKLEYRGYDSAGIAVYDNGNIIVRRKVGKISELEKLTADHQEVIQRWERVLAEFPHVQSGADKNALLKEVLSKVEYSKPKRGTRFGGQDNFTLKIYPRL